LSAARAALRRRLRRCQSLSSSVGLRGSPADRASSAGPLGQAVRFTRAMRGLILHEDMLSGRSDLSMTLRPTAFR